MLQNGVTHSGNKLIGNFKDENIVGSIKIIFANGNIYEGFTQNKKFHGEGKLIHYSGCFYCSFATITAAIFTSYGPRFV